MPYTAQRQSLYGVGSPGYINTAPDIGSAIDAIAGSANSLVQQAYNRRVQQHELQLRDQELQLQQQREAREAAAQNRQLDIAEEGNRIRKLQAGVVPAHDEVSMQAPATPTTVTPKRMNPAAMISGLPSQEGTTALTKPVDLGQGNQPQLVTTHVDESYDPTQSAAYQRSVGLAELRGRITADAIAQRDKDTSQRQEAHDKRVALMRGTAGAKGARPMTEGQRASWSAKTADALLAEHGGNFDDANAWLASDEGKQLRGQGLTETDLYLAHGRATGRLTQQALAFEKGIDAVSPDSATKIVRNTGAAARAQTSGKTPAPAAGGSAKPRYSRAQIETFYQDALKRGADPAKAKARRDSLLSSATP